MKSGPSNTFLGVGEALPRLCNLITVGLGGYFIFGEPPSTTELGLTTAELGVAMAIVGVHGVFTDPAQVNIFRKFLSYMGAAPGAYMAFVGGRWVFENVLS